MKGETMTRTEEVLAMNLVRDLGMIYPTANSKQKSRYGMYLCSCGNIFKANTNMMNRGSYQSCGCKKKELLKKT